VYTHRVRNSAAQNADIEWGKKGSFANAITGHLNGDEQKLQEQTQFVRRRRRVFDSSKARKKNPLQQPASLEITP
jgi:hypothetical protein